MLVHLMGELPEFDRLTSSLKAAGVPMMVASPLFDRNKEFMALSTVEPEDYQKILSYLNYGGKKNFENLFLYLANRFTGASYEVDSPVKPCWEGIYHPDFDYVPPIEEFVEKKVQPGRLTVAVWFHQTQWQGGNTSFVDSLVKEIERQGANALPVFFSGSKDAKLGVNGLEWMIEHYFMKDGKPTVDVVINAMSFSLTTFAGADASIVLKKLGVPIIKAITTCNTFEEWRDTLQGLSVIDIPLNIAMPEFDGDLITVPIAAMDFSQTNLSAGTRIIRFEPIPERIAKLVRLSLNWGKLRHLSNSEKKVAIIFHNYPPRNDTIGHAFGLDASASVMNILRLLKEQGYVLGCLPETSQKLMDSIINGLTNDRRWASPEELAEKALAKISSAQYEKWFNDLPADVKGKMEKDWGEAPGKLFCYNGKLLVAGIINGNVFIGLQPPRGNLEDPSSTYHSPDLSYRTITMRITVGFGMCSKLT